LLFGNYSRHVYIKIYGGSVDAQKLVAISAPTLVDYLNPYPQDNSISNIDNCRIRHCKMFQDIVQATDAIIVYLPLYICHFY